MTKKAFEKIMAGVQSALDVAEGRADPSTYRIHIPAEVDVKAIRKKLGLTQAEFAGRFGFSLGAVRDWEQGRAPPEPSNRVFLTVIDRRPHEVMAALAET